MKIHIMSLALGLEHKIHWRNVSSNGNVDGDGHSDSDNYDDGDGDTEFWTSSKAYALKKF